MYRYFYLCETYINTLTLYLNKAKASQNVLFINLFDN